MPGVQWRTGPRALSLLSAFLFSMAGGCQLEETSRSSDSYYLLDGMWCATHGCTLAQGRIAALTALTQLKMPVYQEGPLRHGLFIDSRTNDNREVRIEIRSHFSRGQGEVTHIGIRVGGFGTHREVCERLLQEIDLRLVPATSVPTTPPVASQGIAPVASVSASPPANSAPALPPQPVPVQN